MPIRDGKRYCITHTKTRMSRTDNFKALMNVSGDAKSGVVDPGAGLIVMTFLCEDCGYLELYVADRERFGGKE
jgi:hypothetical protein